jgi:hypothetical protein
MPLEIPLDGDDHECDNVVPDVNMHDSLLPNVNTTKNKLRPPWPVCHFTYKAHWNFVV